MWYVLGTTCHLLLVEAHFTSFCVSSPQPSGMRKSKQTIIEPPGLTLEGSGERASYSPIEHLSGVTDAYWDDFRATGEKFVKKRV